jgi:hypothetical protein
MVSQGVDYLESTTVSAMASARPISHIFKQFVSMGIIAMLFLPADVQHVSFPICDGDDSYNTGPVVNKRIIAMWFLPADVQHVSFPICDGKDFHNTRLVICLFTAMP